MTEDASIFNEIDESLRAEKLEGFLKNYGKFLVAGCLGIVLATAGSVAWKSHVKEYNIKKTAIILQARELADSGNYTEAISKLEEAEQGGHGISVVAKLFHADVLARSGKFDESVKLYNEIANKKNTDEAIKNISAIYGEALESSHNLPDAGHKLPTGANKPFSVLAGELTALQLQKEGKHKEAVEMLKEISGNPAILMSERSLARDLLDFVNGEKQ